LNEKKENFHGTKKAYILKIMGLDPILRKYFNTIMLAHLIATSAFSRSRLTNMINRKLFRLSSSTQLQVPIEDKVSRTNRCIDFLNDSPEPFNCVKTVSSWLSNSGFEFISEGKSWKKTEKLRPGGKVG